MVPLIVREISVYRMRLVVIFIAIVSAHQLVEAKNNFEAAFQGECREDSPCQHLCFDLHDGTFECACNEGFTLSVNGYSCIENFKLKNRRNWINSSGWLENGTSLEDIDSEDSENAQFFTVKKSHLEALSRTIHANNVEVKFETLDKGNKRTHLPISYEHLYDNSAGRSLNSLNVKDLHFPAKKIHPEHAGDIFQPMNTVVVSTPSVHQIFHTCAELQCESGGICVPHIGTEYNVRCRCPLGRNGLFCEQGVEAKYPRFREGSYLVLPILRDAHKSMQVTLEFRPEANDGLLLYSGEKFDLQGDFISISLNKGFIEFRFDCGMGEGLLISDQPVVLHSWNTLTIYRDRWDAWMQLNSGSQVQVLT